MDFKIIILNINLTEEEKQLFLIFGANIQNEVFISSQSFSIVEFSFEGETSK